MRDIKGLGRAAALAAMLAGPGSALAQAGWEQDLAAEIEFTHQCKVAYLTHVVERTVDGKQVVMAKAHCEDSRVFDAMRPDEFEAFEFNECQPPEAAQSC